MSALPYAALQPDGTVTCTSADVAADAKADTGSERPASWLAPGCDRPALSLATSKARGWDIARLEAGWDGCWNHGREGLMMSWSLGCFLTRTSSDGRSLPDTCSDESMPFVSFGVGVRGGFDL